MCINKIEKDADAAKESYLNKNIKCDEQLNLSNETFDIDEVETIPSENLMTMRC